ncbi:LuxR family maltose regulon positive regulatory protein [Arthrobacter stackebrandtii]|uniref:LuxR family maltose regulon positive regulatory protein n=1 Tax=Arthrobacter stackebrandtii TaxID=272161 RepID=A0ABS4YYB6_9MICC|nr:hypothetical protein [Arthrobacter stackebrandtii]MBP2413797.1 LuxR family maltose regulon positive regulatory protein [Arthrobacter stackebrandtii]PYH00380.1 hypothetical protein CVV67_09710 [Arthrobacter stackebrandtii]
MDLSEHNHDTLVDMRTPREQSDPLVMYRGRVTGLLEARSKAPLLVLRGPMRCGKSVALQHWSNSTDQRLLWLHLSGEQQKARAFWSKVEQAARIHVGSGPAAGNNLARDIPAPGCPAARVAALVHGAPAFTLILENFHHIQPASRHEVETGLLDLLEHAPELRIIVVARSALSIEALHLSSNVAVQVIDRDALAFDDSEAREYHAGTVLEHVSSDLSAQLFGTPVLHRTARMVSTEPQSPNMPLVENVVQRVIDVLRRDLAAVRIQWLSPTTDAFMAATLPVLDFDLPLAQAVCPGLDAAAAIRELAESGLLWTTTTPYSATHGYREFIRKSLSPIFAQQLGAARKQSLSAAADYEFQRRNYYPAFAYAVANEDYRLASSILIRSGLEPMLDGGPRFTATLMSIPQASIVKHPVLCLAAGVANMPRKQTRFKAVEYFTLALASSRLQGKSLPAEDRLATGLAEAVALRLTGQFKMAAAAARKSLKAHAELPLAAHDELARFEALALGQWGLTLLFAGDMAAATKVLHQSVSITEQSKSAQLVFFALSLLAYRYAVDGDLTTAADYAAAAQAALPDMPAVELYQRTPLAMAQALIELGRLDPDSAEKCLAPVMTETSTSEFWGQLRIIEARIELLRGRAGIATGRLDLVLLHRKELPSLNPVDAMELAVVQAELLMAAGNATGAQAALAKLPRSGTSSVLARARMRLGMHQHAEVVELLGGQVRYTSAKQSLEAQLLLTAARLALKPAELVRPDIERISSSVTTLGNHWPLVMLPDTDLQRIVAAATTLGGALA